MTDRDYDAMLDALNEDAKPEPKRSGRVELIDAAGFIKNEPGKYVFPVKAAFPEPSAETLAAFDTFRKVGSKDRVFSPAVRSGFWLDAPPHPGSEIKIVATHAPFIEVPYRTVLVTGITCSPELQPFEAPHHDALLAETKDAYHTALDRGVERMQAVEQLYAEHLDQMRAAIDATRYRPVRYGVSESLQREAALIRAQMDVQPGACACVRVGGVTFPCMLCAGMRR